MLNVFLLISLIFMVVKTFKHDNITILASNKFTHTLAVRVSVYASMCMSIEFKLLT